MRFVERKARNLRSLLHQGPLWANSPVLSPVRLEAAHPGDAKAHGGGPRRYGPGMDTAWWLALVAVVLLAFVTALVDGWGRGHRPRRGRGSGRRGGSRDGGGPDHDSEDA
ncbi:hypothetical protein GCM10010280_61810 [Streptomyces pilosus]|uniref:Uncharacterized protein n=2 Tax=Streptomyces pilosus TaxID=28893 RepID=A0A918C3X8_9ACTN|nr:hypothetical protein GCM10010280_61810 [Streptomyces pilosus]